MKGPLRYPSSSLSLLRAGQLQVTVRRARGLLPPRCGELLSRCNGGRFVDPYCEMRLEHSTTAHVFRTNTKWAQLNPSWDGDGDLATTTFIINHGPAALDGAMEAQVR